MNDKSLRTLIVDDSEDDVLLIICDLKKGGYDPLYERVETAAAMKKALQEKQWDIILCDYSLPKFNAPSAISVLKDENIDIPLIIVSGAIGEDTAVECMLSGAQDYIMKSNLSRLCPAIARELAEAEVREKQRKAEFQREAALEALRQSEEKYRSIIENMHEPYFENALDGNLTFVNDAMCKYIGYSREELIGKKIYRENTDKENSNKIYEAFNRVYRTGEPVKGIEMVYTRKDGLKGFAELSASLIRNAEGKPIGFRGTSHDITERKEAEEALKESERKYRELSIIDDLTQLYNSRHFYAQLEKETERSNRYEQPLTLLLLDLDKFKEFNDTYGHVEGDNVLSRLGQVVKRCLRETDSAYRYGGEEFTIMLPMTTSKEGMVMAQRIQTELKKEAFSPFLGQEVYMTVSIGLAQYKKKEEIKAFVYRVDQLMYQAKKNGRDRICPE
jgi:diguanylate cyclase (GGDEF)-like protein/PAS domain S-box-containing protein